MTPEIKLEQYDDYIKSVDWLDESDSPIAITLTEILEPSEGADAIIFPPTFAKPDKEKPSPFFPYQIDVLDEKLTPQEAVRSEQVANNCLIDSIGSQANRMETLFKKEHLSELVPQVEVKLKTKKKDGENVDVSVNLLDIGHRITDGAIRFSDFNGEVTAAIKSLRNEANAELLARLAPTSLIFGFWDSHPNTTMYKFGRILSSTIRATNVARVNRSAQYDPAYEKTNLSELEEKLKKSKVKLSEVGLDGVPSTNSHGGVQVFGQIVRRTQINLVRLRALAVTKEGKISESETLTLRRYLLGLALIAARIQKEEYDLRIGCLLRCTKLSSQIVYGSGKTDEEFNWSRRNIFEFALAASKEFGVSEKREVLFDENLALKATPAKTEE